MRLIFHGKLSAARKLRVQYAGYDRFLSILMRVLPTDHRPPAQEGGGRRQWRRIWDPCQSFRVSPLNGLWRRNLLRFLGTRSLGLEGEVLEASLICDWMGRRSPKSRIGKFMGPCLALPRVFLARRRNPFFHSSILCSTCR